MKLDVLGTGPSIPSHPHWDKIERGSWQLSNWQNCPVIKEGQNSIFSSVLAIGHSIPHHISIKLESFVAMHSHVYFLRYQPNRPTGAKQRTGTSSNQRQK